VKQLSNQSLAPCAQIQSFQISQEKQNGMIVEHCFTSLGGLVTDELSRCKAGFQNQVGQNASDQ